MSDSLMIAPDKQSCADANLISYETKLIAQLVLPIDIAHLESQH